MTFTSASGVSLAGMQKRHSTRSFQGERRNEMWKFGTSMEEQRIQLRLGKKSRVDLIELGSQYGFDFDDETLSKADIIVELSNEVFRQRFT